jgi:hypothetical protein
MTTRFHDARRDGGSFAPRCRPAVAFGKHMADACERPHTTLHGFALNTTADKSNG